jgi:hypothetical protein
LQPHEAQDDHDKRDISSRMRSTTSHRTRGTACRTSRSSRRTSARRRTSCRTAPLFFFGALVCDGGFVYHMQTFANLS